MTVKPHFMAPIAGSLFFTGLIVGWVASAAAAMAAEATKQKVEAALPQLDDLANAIIKRGDVPGLAIAVVFEDQVVYLKGFGVRETGKPEAVDPDTVFQIASLSKPISATVVASLVSGGIVSWDAAIADLDPGFRLSDPYATAEVTIRDLFSHRSGLAGEAGNDLEGLGYSREEILRRVRFLKPAGGFRSVYSYSNFGLTEGAIAAAKAAGMAWEDVAETRLFKPLGMTSTSARHADFVTRPNRASLHVFIDGRWQPAVKRDPDAQSPAGGVSASARDLTAWLRLELGNGSFNGTELIKPEALAETHRPVIANGENPLTGQPTYYGLGWVTYTDARGLHWRHSGAFSVGARSTADMLPAEHLGIVVLANAFPSGVPEGVADSFFDDVFEGRSSADWVGKWNGVFDAIYGNKVVEAAVAEFAHVPPTPSAALPLADYAGTYASDYLGQAVVSEKDGRLVLALGPKGIKSFPLTHFDRDIFLYYPAAETPTLPVPVQFTIGPDNKATGVSVGGFADTGQGPLKRVN